VPGLKVSSFDFVIYKDVDVLILSLISASVLGASESDGQLCLPYH